MDQSSAWPSGFKLALVSENGLSWRLRKNCSATPTQVFQLYVLLSSISLLISGCFWLIGASLVLPFAFLEVFALGVALWWYAKHAVDGEIVSCNESTLIIDTGYSGQYERYVFLKHTVRIYQEHKAGLIEVSSQGQRVQIGCFLRADLRPVLVSELRRALASL
jgi:uncharacterized membrane protein